MANLEPTATEPQTPAIRTVDAVNDVFMFPAGIGMTPLAADPADPANGYAILWVSDGTGAGDVGDVMMKINVASTVKTVTLVDYSVA